MSVYGQQVRHSAADGHCLVCRLEALQLQESGTTEVAHVKALAGEAEGMPCTCCLCEPGGLQREAALQRTPGLARTLGLHYGTGCWAAESLFWPCLDCSAAARRAVSQEVLPFAAALQIRDLTWPCLGLQAAQHAADQRAVAWQALPQAAAPQTGSWRCR